MKLKALLTSLLLLIAGVASAAITTGYYRIISYNGKYLTENISENKLVCSDLASGNYSQVWYLTVSGSSVKIKNVLTENFIQGQGSFSNQYSTGSSQQNFTVAEESGVYTFMYDSYNQGGLHCDNSNVVVEWYISDDKSKWTVEAVTIDNTALNAQKEALRTTSISQLTTYFTSTACTALNSTYAGYSDDALRSAMSALPTTVQDMAVKVKNNNWASYGTWDKNEKTFRVADYKAYTSHTQWTSVLKFSHSLGRLSNPTGVWVNSGDYLQVYVGSIPSGQSVKLEVAGYGQSSGTVYSLNQGMNALLMATSGNCFVFYEVDNTTSGVAPFTLPSAYADVTVHIEGGSVQGYFDLTKGDDDDDWTQLKSNLLQAGETVCMKTEKHVMNLQIERLSTALGSTSLVAMLNAWANLSQWEDALCGRSDEYGGQTTYGQYCNNITSVTMLPGTGYPHATNYGTYYYDYSDASIFNEPNLMSVADNMWCIAHEQGHNRQGPINMAGNTEVSNNLFSNMAVYMQGRYTSRTANIQSVFQDYLNGVSWPERVRKSCAGEAGYNQHLLKLNWQLYLYFHVLGNKPDFFPRLFDALRADPMTRRDAAVDDGGNLITSRGQFTGADEDYLKYYIKCCEVSGYDLTEFFTAYGFFILPPTHSSTTLGDVTATNYSVINDYSVTALYATQSMIDDAKAAVAAISGLKPCNIVFIEDRVVAPLATYEGHSEGELKTLNIDGEVYGFGTVGETGQYTTYNVTPSAYKYNISDGVVTMEGTGAVGFIVYDNSGSIIGFYNTNTFTLPSGTDTSTITIKAAAGNAAAATATYDSSVGTFPKADTWYTFCSTLRGNLFVRSTSAGGVVYGLTHTSGTQSGDMMWKFVSRGDNTYDIINRNDNSYLDPTVAFNAQMKTTATQPSSGWTLGAASTSGMWIIHSGTVELNQSSDQASATGFKTFNWSAGGSGNDTSDTGCQFTIMEALDNVPADVIPAGEEEEPQIVSDVTDVLSVGAKVTAESQLVSGKLYLLRNTATGNPWISDAGTYYSVPNGGGTLDERCMYYLIKDGDDTWKIKNYATGKYWGEPTAASTTNQGGFVPTDEADAGSWSLNFNSSNNIDPKCNGFFINRSSQKLHAWSSSLSSQIYEVILSYPPFSDFTDKDISVSTEASASLQTGQWYVMFDRGANHGYLYENSSNRLYNTATAPSGSATDNAKYLVRIVGWDNEYYLQTGLGNFFGKIQGSTAVPTTSTATEKITIKKIADTDGHFYLMSADGVILDANDVLSGDATVVGWGTTAPTTTGGNNDWAFYPVEFVDSWIPDISEVYTINNVNTYRGAMMYNGTSDYVWSSGKSGTFSATDPNCQWVLAPTGTAKQYYLYNVGAGKFAIPSGTNSTASWVFSSDAVAVTLLHQSDGTYKIKTVTTDTYAAVSNGYNGPIINYNDIGGNFTITKVDGDQSTSATAAMGKLTDNVTPLSAVPASGSDGWYIIRINQHGTYADKYVYVPENEIAYNGTNYPLTFDHGANIRPSISDVTYYTRITLEGSQLYWQMPNGKYLYGNNSKFPVSTTTKSSCSMDYTSGKGFRMWGSSRYAVPYLLGSQYFIGETSNNGNAYYDVYPVDLEDAGLTAWQVVINGGSETTQITCSRNDVSGLRAVYNNGYFFLPTGVTPAGNEFSLTGMLSCEIDADAKTITVEYNPELSLLQADVAVIQGNQTTGLSNTMQALLRIKATPFSDFQPTQFSINLTGAANVDNVKVYSTSTDQIRATNANPILLGTANSPSDGTVTIDVSSNSVSAGTTLYYWITADVKSSATEWGTIDASLTSISYTNSYKQTNSLADTELDLSSVGNPTGEMRIYKRQSELWTASMAGSQYYRIPAIINTADGGILALTDDRHTSSGDLGNHKIDVVARKSMDGGLTWGDAVTVATGDGSSDAAYGYGDPAVVRTNSGKLICLMAAGKNSYSGGMLHMGYSESTNNGATWSTPVDIYSSINKNGLSLTSVFTSAGKGVTFSNGRVAFAMNGKTSSGTDEYIIYSDDEGASWNLSPTVAFSGADESKLEIMNDNSLLLSVRRGGFNSMANRGYNRTTGDASGEGINNWDTQGIWDNEMNANGCNADILYYNRDTEDASRPDVIFHTLTKNFSTFRKDLRLYMSFDQGATWMEAFQLQPGYAAYSSMQKLANGDLAIIFEDGSIGNEDKQDCYAIDYVVLSSELINAKIDELYEESFYEVVKNSVQGSSTGANTYGSFSDINNTWAKKWTSNASSGMAGLTISTDGYVFNHSNVYNQRCFAMRPSSNGATDVITITAPSGYYIDSYTITGRNYSSNQTYQLYVDENAKTTTSTNGATFSVNNVNAPSTSFKFYGSSTTNYLCITNFTIKLVPVTTYTRSVTAGRWGTVCVPGAVESANISGAEIYRIAGKVVNEQSQPTSLKLEQVENMEAGKPYLFLPLESSDQLSLTYLGNAVVSMPRSENGLFGSFAGMDVAEGMYLLKDNTIVLCGTDCNIGANRAYIDMNEVPDYEGPSAGVKSLTIFCEDPDGIESIQIQNEGAVYDLSGRRISAEANSSLFTLHSSFRKGIYIVNGRKVIIK